MIFVVLQTFATCFCEYVYNLRLSTALWNPRSLEELFPWSNINDWKCFETLEVSFEPEEEILRVAQLWTQKFYRLSVSWYLKSIFIFNVQRSSLTALLLARIMSFLLSLPCRDIYMHSWERWKIYSVLVRKRERKRPLGVPRRGEDDNIKIVKGKCKVVPVFFYLCTTLWRRNWGVEV